MQRSWSHHLFWLSFPEGKSAPDARIKPSKQRFVPYTMYELRLFGAWRCWGLCADLCLPVKTARQVPQRPNNNTILTIPLAIRPPFCLVALIRRCYFSPALHPCLPHESFTVRMGEWLAITSRRENRDTLFSTRWHWKRTSPGTYFECTMCCRCSALCLGSCKIVSATGS